MCIYIYIYVHTYSIYFENIYMYMHLYICIVIFYIIYKYIIYKQHIFLKYIHACVCIYIYIINIHSNVTHSYIMLLLNLRHHDIIEYTAKTKQNTPTQCKHTQLRDEVWFSFTFKVPFHF